MTYAVLICASLQLISCGSTYKVATASGDIFYAEGRPNIDKETNQLIFEDQNGKEVILDRDKVNYIQETDIPEM